MDDVADNHEADPLEGPEGFAQGERVEQRLGWMGVHAVAGVHDAQAGGANRQVRRPRGSMAQHERRDPGPLERAQRVDERLALGNAAAGDRQVDGRRPEGLCGQLERDARARRDLVEGEPDHVGLQQ